MSQRASGYKRKSGDRYLTPPWVTYVLCKYLLARGHAGLSIWEPACGVGQMVQAIDEYGFDVFGSDLSEGVNFLECRKPIKPHINAIVSNPPFNHAEEFIVNALNLMRPVDGLVAMLTRIDYDSAHTRRYLFAEHPAFACKIVLTRRIVWFEKKGAAPSFNHGWLIWNWKHRGKPTIEYGP